MTAGRSSGTLTVLFTDLVGSTELMANLGEAAFDQLRAEHFDQLRAVLSAHGGTEVKNTGDGLMATFSSAADAVVAAAAMQQATDGQARRGAVPIAIRIGVALGDVTLEDGDVFGTAVVEAARLVAAARPGQILVTAVVRMVGGGRSGAAFTDLGPLQLKGLPDPISAWDVAWEPLDEAAAAVVPLPSLLVGAGRIFVGREEELERLRQHWKEAGAGERRLVLVGGEPGVGKTRLATELARSLHGEGTVVLAGRCDEDLGVPYQPLVEAVRHYLAHAAAPRLGRHAGELVRLVPELAQLVPGLPAPMRSDPETERYRLFDAVAAWLADVSAEAPVLVVVDDLQWAAKPTLLLLRHVLRSPDALKLLIVATYRDTDVGRGHPLAELLADVPRLEGAERLPLTGLDVPAVAAFLEQAAGHALDQEGDELARVVWRETEGNAFFVAEVLRHLVESKAIEEVDGRWVLTAAIEEPGIPEGVRDVVGRRLSRLSDEANRVLACASVVGLEFEPALVQTAGSFTEEAVLAALEEAVATRLLVDVPGAVPRNRFAHALVRATLYDELTAARRVALHRRVAEGIEARYAGRLDDHLPALAHHWSRASAPAAETDRAVDYATRAGDRALAQLAHDEAVTYYRSALELLDASGAADDARRLELLIALGEAQRRAGHPAHRETLLEAADLARQRGETEALARAALANSRPMLFTAWNVVDTGRIGALEAAVEALGIADSPVRARLLANLALELIFSERDRRVALSDEALAMARRLGDAETLAHVLLARYLTLEPSAVADRVAEAVELLGVVGSVPDPATQSRAWSLCYRMAMEAGDAVEASAALQRAEELARDVGEPVLGWMLSYLRVGHALVGGRFTEAKRLAEDGREIGRRAGQEAEAVFATQMCSLHFELGDFNEEAEAVLDAVPERHRIVVLDAWRALLHLELGRDDDARGFLDHLAPARIPLDLFWLITVNICAEVAGRLGDRTRAVALYEALRPHADHSVGLPALPTASVSHHLALLARTLERFSAAEEHFRAAIVTHERLGAPAWLARTRLEWAELLRRRGGPGDAEHAAELLAQALATAVDLGLGAVERRAGALLEAGS